MRLVIDTGALYYRTRSKWWRLQRLLFPSPAELRLIELMGGRVLRFDAIKHWRTGFSLAVIISMGNIFKRELVGREMRVGKFWVDFGINTKYYKKGIEVDGDAWHKDIIADMEREEYIRSFGYRVLRIRAIDVYNNPSKVQQRVLWFLGD